MVDGVCPRTIPSSLYNQIIPNIQSQILFDISVDSENVDDSDYKYIDN